MLQTQPILPQKRPVIISSVHGITHTIWTLSQQTVQAITSRIFQFRFMEMEKTLLTGCLLRTIVKRWIEIFSWRWLRRIRQHWRCQRMEQYWHCSFSLQRTGYKAGKKLRWLMWKADKLCWGPSWTRSSLCYWYGKNWNRFKMDTTSLFRTGSFESHPIVCWPSGLGHKCYFRCISRQLRTSIRLNTDNWRLSTFWLALNCWLCGLTKI